MEDKLMGKKWQQLQFMSRGMLLDLPSDAALLEGMGLLKGGVDPQGDMEEVAEEEHPRHVAVPQGGGHGHL